MSYDNYLADTEEYRGYTIKVHYDQDAENPLERGGNEHEHIKIFHRDYTNLDLNMDHSFGIVGSYYDGYVLCWEGERGEYHEDSVHEFSEIIEHLESRYGAEVVRIKAYEHSGITISAVSDTYNRYPDQQWDVHHSFGLIFMTDDDIKKELSIYRKGFDRKRREIYTRFRTCTNGKPVGDRDRKVWTEWFNADTQQWTRDECWWRKHVRVTNADRQHARERMVSVVEEVNSWLTGECYGYTIDDPYEEELDDSCWGFIGDMKYCIDEAKAVVDHDITRKEEELAKDLDTFAFLEDEVA